jgi:hypothetical protein
MLLDRFRVYEIPGEPLRFHVQSRTRADLKHLVDLMELNGRGRCSCEHFEYRSTAIKKFTCDHIKAGQIHLAKKVVSRCLETEKAHKARKGVVAAAPAKLTYLKGGSSKADGPGVPAAAGDFPWEAKE